ncbi:drug/metabolite transporter (DMT)-like permease [Bradyrhizobium sp. R2.2-H]|jgi:drug/metabolite transporter (DMT)-like permease|uniref:DMT family transporter n=1 Tax=unclassified Bradyrhizobium TaxID=2631580 RepID=UPI00104A86A8|nr:MULTISPECIES: DMT family transporter [unclassified Bradyrhizobium]TCU74949.1 drug/metabolite transporter (DMT)-like permease [Bradyrhizobium sp. Y-H1]TCU77717.1 drug/metabolite transporter (DMT)-like permease [Bradyrhizobium sp. R2.2-H]
MPPNANRIDARDWSLLCVLSILWGGSFFFNGAALRELPPLTLVFLRVGLGAAILLPLLRMQGIGFPEGMAGWKPFVAIGLLNNVIPFSLIVIGQTFIPSGLASILNATTPMFAVLVMAAAGEEALQMRRVAGVALGLFGVIILRGWGIEARPGQGLGILLCLGGALSYGFAALAARRLLKDSPPLGTATFQLMASTVMMAIIAGAVEQPWQLAIPSLTTWLAVLGLAALSTALAYIVFFQIVRRSGASNVMLVTLLIPVTAILLGWLVLGESISMREIAGAIVIGSALLVIDGRAFSLLRKLSAASRFSSSREVRRCETEERGPNPR